MPTYRVRTDQGDFKVTLDREPESPEELQRLVEAHFAEAPDASSETTPASSAPAPTTSPRTPGRRPYPSVTQLIRGEFNLEDYPEEKARGENAAATVQSTISGLQGFMASMPPEVVAGVASGLGPLGLPLALARATGPVRDLLAKAAPVFRALRRAPSAAPAAEAVAEASRDVSLLQPPRALPSGARPALPPVGATSQGRPERIFVAGPQPIGEGRYLEGLPEGPRIVTRRTEPSEGAFMVVQEKATPGGAEILRRDDVISRRSPFTQVESNRRTAEEALRLAEGKRPLDFGRSGVVRRNQQIDASQVTPEPPPPPPGPEDYVILSGGTEVQASKAQPKTKVTTDVSETVTPRSAIRPGTIQPEAYSKYVPRSTPPPVEEKYRAEKVGRPIRRGAGGRQGGEPPSGPGGPGTTEGPGEVPPTAASRIAELKAKVYLPHIFEATPSEIARGIPPAEEIVTKTMNRAAYVDALKGRLTKAVEDIYKGLPEESIKRVNRALDGGPLHDLTPEEAVVFQKARKFFDDLAEAVGLEPNRRITSYFPRIRERLGIKGRQIIKVGEDEVPVYIQEVLPDKYVKAFFEKPRTLNAPADDLTLQPVVAYVEGAANRIGKGGGFDPTTGERVTGLIDELTPHLKQLPENLVDYFSTYVNDFLGIPRTSARPGISPRTASTLKSWQFMRTLGANPAAIVQNLGGGLLNTFSEVRPDSFFKAFSVLRQAQKDPKFLSELRDLGVLRGLTKTDLEFLRTLDDRSLAGVLNSLSQKSARGFGFSEDFLRAHAYLAGKLDAQAAGLSEAEAVQHGLKAMRNTQFVYGKENAPASFRAPLSSNPLGALAQTSVRQYKQFTINQLQRMKNLVVDDAKDLATGKSVQQMSDALSRGDYVGFINSLPFAKTGKYWLTGSAIFGSDAMTAGLDKALSEAITGDRDTLTIKGVLPGALGLFLGHMVGLGAVPAEDARSVLFMLPGPLISNFMDAFSAGLSIALGRDVNLSPTDLAQGVFGRGRIVGSTLDIDKQVGKITRSIPVAGVLLERLRQSVVQFRNTSPSTVRKPVNLRQSLGLSPVNETNPQVRTLRRSNAAEATARVLGAESPESAEARRASQALTSESADLAELANKISELLIAGQTDEANKLLEYGLKKYGTVPLSEESLREAVLRAAADPATRQFLRSSRRLRGRAAELLGPILNTPED